MLPNQHHIPNSIPVRPDPNHKQKPTPLPNDNHHTRAQGGIEANLGGTIWTPLTVDETFADRPVQPSYIVHSLPDMRAFLPPLNNNSHQAATGGSAPPTAATGDVAPTPRRSSVGSKANCNGGGGRSGKLHGHHQLRVASLPDLDSGNSNSSDGS